MLRAVDLSIYLELAVCPRGVFCITVDRMNMSPCGSGVISDDDIVSAPAPGFASESFAASTPPQKEPPGWSNYDV